MNYFDIAITSITLISALFGYLSGFLGSFLNLVRTVGAILLTYTLVYEFNDIIGQVINDPAVVRFVVPLATFILCMIILTLCKVYILHTLNSVRKGGIDRSLGVVFGIVRAVLILCVVFIMITGSSGGLTVKESRLGKYSLNANYNKLPTWVQDTAMYGILRLMSNILLNSVPESEVKKIDAIIKQPTLLIPKQLLPGSDIKKDNVDAKKQYKDKKKRNQNENDDAKERSDEYKNLSPKILGLLKKFQQGSVDQDNENINEGGYGDLDQLLEQLDNSQK